MRTGDRLVFFTDGLLEARDRAGRFFRLDQQVETLRQPDLQVAADELPDRLRAYTRRRLDDDVAVLLAELTLTDPAPSSPPRQGQLPAAARRVPPRCAAESGKECGTDDGGYSGDQDIASVAPSRD